MININDNFINIILPDSNGNIVDVSKINSKYIIIYFYSKDNTSGCNNHNLEYKKYFEDFKNIGAYVIGISKDSVTSHFKYKNKYDFPFVLLSDENKKAISDYDLFKEKNMYGKKVMGVVRSSFIISGGKYIKVNYNAKAMLDAKENLEFLNSL